MPWIRLDDQFPDHPKVVEAGPLASWLYVCGIGYCNRLLTDGFIPSGQVRKLADVDNAGDLAQRLVAVGLWDETEGGYLVHDYLDYQPSREKALELREKRAEAGSRGGKQKASNLLADSQANAIAKSKQNSTPYPSRTHPLSSNAVNTLAIDDVPPFDGTAPTQPAPPNGGEPMRPAPKPTTLNAVRQARFDRWYKGEGVPGYNGYPNKQHRPEAERAWAKLDPDDDMTERLISDIQQRRGGRKWTDGMIEHPSTYLNQRVWEDDIEPIRIQPRERFGQAGQADMNSGKRRVPIV